MEYKETPRQKRIMRGLILTLFLGLWGGIVVWSIVVFIERGMTF